MNVKAFIRKYHIVASTVVFISLIIVCAFFFVEKSKKEESKRFGSMLFKAFVLNQSQGKDLIDKLSLNSDSNKNFISDFSKASLSLENKDFISSNSMYERVANNKNADKFFSHYALYMLAIDDFKNDNVEKLMKKIDRLSKTKFFKYHALEIKGLYMLKKGEVTDAKMIFEEIFFDGNDGKGVPTELFKRCSEIYYYLNA